MSPIRLSFQGGTVRVEGPTKDAPPEGLPPSAAWDEREGVHRLPAVDYARLVLGLRAKKIPFEDAARAPDPNRQIQAYAQSAARALLENTELPPAEMSCRPTPQFSVPPPGTRREPMTRSARSRAASSMIGR